MFHVPYPPRANALFPKLAAVFDLQAGFDFCTTGSNHNHNSTNNHHHQTSSSHCAVNANVRFTPHVDSGREAEQSLSTVGLGAYRAEEIVMEGHV
mmetsp:Transcript_19671/g.22630  ORF Transcript_19671/g.22630 Transcript_19671/m.22630 type:complete len:95 (-) Transcript_19671:180-464(-)